MQYRDRGRSGPIDRNLNSECYLRVALPFERSSTSHLYASSKGLIAGRSRRSEHPGQLRRRGADQAGSCSSQLQRTKQSVMSAQAGPGPSSTAYLQAQNKNGSATNPNGPSSVLAPLGGMAEEQEPGVPNIFTDAQLEEFKEQDRYLPVGQIS